ncbi:hypothetical protein Mgra_00007640 [Meloidogyne graminicola]|uniref:Uncharacterized protein n=1 Tax=Meloidogyne graminicola TaxID=189291 RepID=A0A8S9ZHY5_9BILA|nr:hypothetical protein Mgra_00007640 [Meloidogyne graminicola]
MYCTTTDFSLFSRQFFYYFYFSIYYYLFASIFLIFPSKGLKFDNDEFELNLQLIKHQPCAYRPDKSKWERKVEFEAGNEKEGPKLIPRANETNCYSIGGKVTVYSEFKGEFSIYLELRSSANKKQVPEQCNNRREDGCGGFGSCLYCDACQTLETNKELKAQLLLNGKPISCGEIVKPGTYENMELAFCLPNADEMLKSQGLTKETFRSLIQSDGGNNIHSLGVFATIYVFDRDVRKLMQTQQKVEAVYRKSKKSLFRDEPLPPDVYWSLPFNSLIKEQRAFVVCHKIFGNVQIRTQQPIS